MKNCDLKKNSYVYVVDYQTMVVHCACVVAVAMKSTVCICRFTVMNVILFAAVVIRNHVIVVRGNWLDTVRNLDTTPERGVLGALLGTIVRILLVPVATGQEIVFQVLMIQYLRMTCFLVSAKSRGTATIDGKKVTSFQLKKKRFTKKEPLGLFVKW